jgi:FixJ family two-component response regulator
LEASRYSVFAFSSARQFLEEHDRAVPGCAVIDFAMQDINGLVLQGLASSGIDRPVIFISDVNDVRTGVRAMKAGAVDFLPKPVGPEDLLLAVQTASERDLGVRLRRRQEALVHRRLSILTCREAEVMRHVIAGMPNKLIAHTLGVGIKTVKVHRGRLMRKMGLRTVADLVRVAQLGGISPAFPDCRIAGTEAFSPVSELLTYETPMMSRLLWPQADDVPQWCNNAGPAGVERADYTEA